ncbi:MAG: DUF4918 family protein [Chitinophagales bacterium]|nr:DUF4918 family protein [Chitinophagales bacterium]
MPVNTFADRAISFFNSLELELDDSLKIGVLNPYQSTIVKNVVDNFFTKYFNDRNQRIFIFGINPGRHGGGITGISFTDPLALLKHCGIENVFNKRFELSSEFIYRVIERYGGPGLFYRHFFLTAICPLGFTKDNKNYNYYDDKKLLEAVEPFIRETFNSQINIGAKKDVLICLGTGKNKRFIETLNNETQYFKKVIALEHPRFIMQYKRKKLEAYIQQYVNTISDLVI